ncbi:MAG: baseplate J/gp47 family protein [Lewinellaceae bacterium]|nr:baseplate J/gp47 family protein [Lewinellaceae bacterium]
MAKPCERKNPLVRSGSNQKDRLPAALSPENARIDERTVSDYILFAKRYAPFIKYYNSANLENGNWESFWNNDLSAVLATLAEYPIDIVRDFQLSLRTYLISLSGTPDSPQLQEALKRHFKLWFHLSLIVIRELIDQLYRLPLDHELREKISLMLERDGKDAIDRIIAYHKGALAGLPVAFDDGPLQAEDFQIPAENITLPDVVADQLLRTPLFTKAQIQLPFTQKTWATYYKDQPEDLKPFQEENVAKKQIFDALQYNLFTAAFDRIMELMTKAGREAARYLDASLTGYPGHTPHYGLWLTFLRLLRYNQDHLNTYTRRHLEYYYQEVLQLFPRKPVPDQAHLLFELARNQSSHLLKTGTLFKAGKDDKGNPVAYQLRNDIVINEGRVVALKSVFLPDDGFPVAASKVDTLDGIQEPLPKEYPQWQAFFEGQKQSNGSLEPKARLGFAVADPQLFLREGDRKISLTFNRDLPLKPGNDFRVYYTSEKEWVEVTTLQRDPSNHHSLLITLQGDQLPVLPFNPKFHVDEAHPDDFGRTLPVLKFVLVDNYSYWKSFSFSSLRLSVDVENVRNFTIYNRDGVADVSKPFPLFGSNPGKLPYFVLGSSEVFSKKLKKLELTPEWEELYTTSDFFYSSLETAFRLRLQYLDKGKWEGETFTREKKYHEVRPRLFLAGEKQNTIEFNSMAAAIPPSPNQPLENPALRDTTTSGFIRIESIHGFGNDRYIDEKTVALLANAKTAKSYSPPSGSGINVDVNKVPKAPYSARLNNLTLHYETELVAPVIFHQLYPFGFQQEKAPKQVIPVLENKGELYIGVEKLAPPQRLTLLAQVVDGTAAPLAEPAEAAWTYLRNNSWKSGPGLEIDDKSDQFTRSGIIGIAIPGDANREHTVLPTGLHWLRCSVALNTGALNALRSLDAQAALVEFIDQKNDPAFLEKPLEAETINKPALNDIAVKKVRQPYPSFGGRGQEPDDRYYTRVSERLRHKNRAIQIWDYERLVLEQFPGIFKVKCLNHTELDNGLSPGNVTLVCIPRIQAAGKDPLRPYTEKKTLLDICRHLRTKVSPFVRLKVVQPRLEEVQLDFSVAFTEDIADIPFYKKLLNEAIIRFLSPWAFEEGQEISFGGQWYKSTIIDFIDEQPYVDFVKEVKMFHKTDIEQSDNAWSKVDVEVIEATTARSILVSHRTHVIRNINRTDAGVNIELSDCISEKYRNDKCQ